MSKSTYKHPEPQKKKGPTPFVRGTSIVLAVALIASILASLATQF
jgi:hypothetical protein